MDKNKKLFPQRLWELIHDEKYDFCLRWSPDGQRVYLNRNDFETHYLRTPNNQFHTQKAISFVRQMNMYGFRKVDDCYYENDNFKRNCHHLLKNMVRRHSNKGFFSPSNQIAAAVTATDQHMTNPHNHRQVSHHQQQHDRINSIATITNNNNNSSHNQQNQTSNNNQPSMHHPTLYHSDSQNPSSAAARIAATERQASRCFRDAGGSVGNIGAAMAAAITSDTPQSTLASTLYHRLAALNFGNQANKVSDQQQQMIQQQRAPRSTIATDLTRSRGTQNQDLSDSRRILPHNRPALGHDLNQFDIIDNPTSSQQQHQQQSLAARQALQQNLVRSYLQLKQPQPTPMSLQQNLLASLQQQNPNLLLESLASLSSANGFISPLLHEHAASVSPLELVVNSISNVTTPDHDQNNQYLRFNASNNNSTLNSTESSNMTNNNRSLFDQMDFDDDDDDDNDGELDNDECEIDVEGEILNRNGDFLRTTHSSSSSSNHDAGVLRYPLDQEDSEDAVLDLAKPSSTRSINGRQKMPRTSE